MGAHSKLALLSGKLSFPAKFRLESLLLSRLILELRSERRSYIEADIGVDMR